MNPQYINIYTFVHFTLWFMFGLIYPHQYGMLIILSILWEVSEHYMVRQRFVYNSLRKNWIIPEKYWNETLGNNVTDIIANTAGYLLASKLHQSPYRLHFFCIALFLLIHSIIYSIRANTEQSKQS